jgi:competence protein ComEA
VYVSGAVARPDVYVLPPNSVVKDALSSAGGSLPRADLSQINLAREVFDQQHVHVPLIGETPPAQLAPPAAGPSCVNVNAASLEELETLPGIGPTYSRAIIEYRQANGPFRDVEELAQVRGIGPTTLELIRDLVCLQ